MDPRDFCQKATRPFPVGRDAHHGSTKKARLSALGDLERADLDREDDPKANRAAFETQYAEEHHAPFCHHGTYLTHQAGP